MKRLQSILPITVTMAVIYTFFHTGCALLKYYPVCMNFFFFSMFTISAFQNNSLIKKLAKRIDPDLTLEQFNTYTRNLTYVWILVTFTNLIMSFSTLFLSDKIWAIYNGCISYMLVGSALMVEFIVRMFYKKRLATIVEHQ